MKIYMSILCFFSLSTVIDAQDAMVIGFNFDNQDGMSIVALKDIPEGKPIYVTETPYDDANNNFDRTGSNRGTISLNWTGTWMKGTVIGIEELAAQANNLVATSGAGGPSFPSASLVYPSDVFSLSSEGFTVYTSNNAIDPDAAPLEIFTYVRAETASGVNDPDPSEDTDCPCSDGFISVDLLGTFATDFAEFRPSLRGMSLDALALSNPTNWDTGPDYVSLNLNSFNIVLPVVWSAFSVEIMKEDLLLKWETLSEINNNFFSIEHSMNGKDFIEIHKQRGGLTTIDKSNYSFLHKDPEKGVNYFRLKQIDLNGAFSYSNVVSVSIEQEMDLTPYPNPFQDQISISMNSSSDKEIEARIYDLTGKLLLSSKFHEKSDIVNLNLQGLNSGKYILQTFTNDNLVSHLITKI